MHETGGFPPPLCECDGDSGLDSTDDEDEDVTCDFITRTKSGGNVREEVSTETQPPFCENDNITSGKADQNPHAVNNIFARPAQSEGPGIEVDSGGHGGAKKSLGEGDRVEKGKGGAVPHLDRASKMRVIRRRLEEKRKKRKLADEDWLGDWATEDIDVKTNSRDVPNHFVQDRSVRMVIVGSDVVALFPCLVKGNVAETCYQAVLDCDIVFEEVDYVEGCRYIALNWSEARCRTSKLGRVLPWRRKKTGVRPGVTGIGPKGAERGDTEQWEFPKVTLTELEKREVVATVVMIGVEKMFETHLYSFSGKVDRQAKEGPIGLRSTCSSCTCCHVSLGQEIV